MTVTKLELQKTSTGIVGLDDILGGGWPMGRLYLVLGNPGTGKTTLGMQFLLEGVNAGERVLYMSLSETTAEIGQVAASHGWSLDGVALYELSAAEQVLGLARESSMFDPSEVEFRATTRAILQEIERVEPTRVVFDSLSELALLAREPLAFRRELLLLKQVFLARGATVLLLSDQTTPDADLQLQSLTHGVLELEELAPEFGGERRRLRVRKLRGSKYRSGYHDYRIETGGLLVFPRLVPAEHSKVDVGEPLSSGMADFDALLGGGLPRGSSTLLMGPAGSGKSTLVAQFVAAALGEGHSVLLILFDETTESFLRRSEKLGIGLLRFVDEGLLTLTLVNAAELCPGELSTLVREHVERSGTKLVVLDSLNGYIHAMPEERFLLLHIHELLTYLNLVGVTTLMTLAQHGFVGSMRSPVDLTYMADAVLLLRFFESQGRILRAISMVKNRVGGHENTIRQISIESGGIRLGQPLTQFQGVLTGVPIFTGDSMTLLEQTRAEPDDG
ncbi:MAG: AAA family ATPase [Deltaproteobacteria bacterium]|nr:AAA family ATPase [Deltaproteobacteria bacterium]